MHLLGNYILCKPVEKPNGKLILPDAFKERSREYEVVEAGPKTNLEPGEIIVVDRAEGISTEVAGETYYIFKDTAVYAIL